LHVQKHHKVQSIHSFVMSTHARRASCMYHVHWEWF